MTPSAGVFAHSVGSIAMGTFTVAFGATVSNAPWLIALVNALYLPTPGAESTVSFARSKLSMWYVKRGFAALRHGSPVRQSCDASTGSNDVLESVGDCAR